METIRATRVPAKPVGLIVVGVADGSPAASHGGISPGMMLVEVNRERVAGMSQEKMTRLMRQVASQPRVLTLARITGYRLPAPPTPQCEDGSSACSAEIRPEATQINLAQDKPCTVQAASSDAVNAGRQTSPDAANTIRHTSPENSRPHALASSTTVANGGNATLGSGSASTLLIPLRTSYINRAISTGSSVQPESSQNRFGHPRASTSTCPQRLIALRFVGSRGNTSLFDRDHVLGLKMRDIEFVPTSVHLGGVSSHSSRLAEEHRRANSKLSLQDLTRDWRNDPFSTPARRRRLINDACKVIVRSYTHASVSRVAELRREEFHIVRIQAGYRMRKARRLFRAKLAKRRVKAASVLQLGWLSCVARNRVGLLRAERNQYRRAEEDKRARRQARERKERSRREEEQREAEGREIRKRRDLRLLIFVQRRIRAKREARRRQAQHATRLHAEQRRKAAAALQVAANIRRLQDKRRWLQEEQAQQKRARGTRDAEGGAAIRFQTLWRRWTAIKLLERRRSERTGASTFALPAHEETAQKSYGSSTYFDVGAPCPSNSASGSPKRKTRKLLRRERSERTEGNASSGKNRSSAFEVNPSLAAEIAREETQVDTASRDSSRPWTATGAIEQSVAMAPPVHPHAPGPPPAGMMTVTVRRGSEETNLVTPIVLTESGGEGEVPPTPPASELEVLPPAEVAAAVSGDGFDDSNSVDRASHVDRVAQSAVSNVEVGGAVPAALADGALEEKIPLRPKAESPADAASTGMALMMSTLPPLRDRESDTLASRKHLSLPSAAINGPANDHAVVPQPNEGGAGKATTTAVLIAIADESGSQRTAATATNEATADADRVMVKPPAQLFMEDSQVYLGCTICGVKYLVEAVDPRVGKTVQVGQQDPEVLYLCTTCGGTLRNNGEDGRWKRRRRPSSAPPASRRRGGALFFSGDSSDGDVGKCNIVGGADAERWNGVTSAAVADGLLAPVGISRQLLRVERKDRPVESAYSTTRLTYAHCARRIQHVYRDFRHRQYLRDWALSLLRRWLACRVRSRRKVKRRVLRRRAVVTVQSAARAAFARTRCAHLRAARLRLWMKRFAALYGDDGDDSSVSPMATVLLKDLGTNPPSPSPLQTPAQLQPPALLPQCPACATPPGSMRGAGRSTIRGRALAEALAPRMGRPPPGCPAALDVDWGEWGVGFTVAFPHSPRVGRCRSLRPRDEDFEFERT